MAIVEDDSGHRDNQLVEHLTRREKEILALLPQDLTSREIAKKLTIAPASAKWYIQHIYGKLGVNNRRQALQRAYELGLLAHPAIQVVSLPSPDPGKAPANALPLPTGTVTYLFTDIEGSVSLWDQHNQAMKEAVAKHHLLIRRTVEAHGGLVFKVMGDEFQIVFRLAKQALEAALEVQRLLKVEPLSEIGPLRVRMGLHSGPAELDERGDYSVSHTLNRVARLRSAGHGEQILLSLVTADLLCDQLPEGVTLKDMGEYRLKGLLRPERIFQVVAPGLRSDFPPLVVETYPQHNLSLQISSFIGREKDFAQVMELVRNNRLVILTGIGGVGKTRLGLKVGEELLGEFPNGVWLVSLASVTDPMQVPQVVAQVFGLRSGPGRPVETELVNYLRGKNLLLLLDNCEHLVEACARLAVFLLSSCPDVRILATSREALGVEGETQFPVPPLSVPGHDMEHEIAGLDSYDSVRLFVERAGDGQRNFVLTDENAMYVVQICRRLDGIPLALELASARVKLFGVAQVAARLDNCFKMLGTGSRTALPRHQTLRAAIDWSYDLLSVPERMLFRRLSVFNSGWSLEAAEQVCQPGQLEGWDIPDLLGLLVMKSLVATQLNDRGAYRYTMLEVVRQYAREKLVEMGEEKETRQDHFAYFLEAAGRNEAELHGKRPFEAFLWLAVEHPNLQSALDWTTSEGFRGDPAAVVRLRQLMHQDFHGWGSHMLSLKSSKQAG